HAVIGGIPGVIVLGLRRLLAGDTQRTVLVFVEHVPDPGDRGLSLHDLGSEISAYAVSRGLLARDPREPPRLRLVTEIAHKRLELPAGRAVDRFKCHGGAARLRCRYVACGILTTAGQCERTCGGK